MGEQAECLVEGCLGDVKRRGWCYPHYRRWLRHGDPLAGGAFHIKGSVQERIAAKSRAVPSGCIEWTGSIGSHGYGELSIGNRAHIVHRLVWAEAFGPIPPRMVIDHKCHNRACVNLAHLQCVTRSENNQNRQGAMTGSSSGVRGVYWHSSKGRWGVRCALGGKTYSGGYFTQLEDAEQAAIELRNRVMTNNLVDRGENL